jgi:hypothetical protein
MQGLSQLRQVLGLTTESCDLFNQFRNKLNNSLEQNCPGYKISIKQIFLLFIIYLSRKGLSSIASGLNQLKYSAFW